MSQKNYQFEHGPDDLPEGYAPVCCFLVGNSEDAMSIGFRFGREVAAEFEGDADEPPALMLNALGGILSVVADRLADVAPGRPAALNVLQQAIRGGLQQSRLAGGGMGDIQRMLAELFGSDHPDFEL